MREAEGSVKVANGTIITILAVDFISFSKRFIFCFARIVLNTRADIVPLNTAANRRGARHAIEHRPIDTHLMRSGIAEFHKSRLNIHLPRFNINLIDDALARIEHHTRGGDHNGVGLRECLRHFGDFPGRTKVSAPSSIKLFGELLRIGVSELKNAGRNAPLIERGFRQLCRLGLRLKTRRFASACRGLEPRLLDCIRGRRANRRLNCRVNSRSR